jgi:hypothetical protein
MPLITGRSSTRSTPSGQAFLAEGTENSGAVFTFGNPDDPNSSWINENNDNIGLAFNADFSAAVPPPPSVNFIEYSAKFLCGETREGASVRPGTYETSINIHNPQLFLGSVTFVKKAVPAPRQGDPQKIKPKFRDGSVLDADYAERVDCKRIRDKLLDPAVSGDPFIEGFVVLVVIPVPWPSEPRELDVVAVYTVDTPPRSISLEIKTIAPRVLSLPGQVGYDMRDQLLRSLKPE